MAYKRFNKVFGDFKPKHASKVSMQYWCRLPSEHSATVSHPGSLSSQSRLKSSHHCLIDKDLLDSLSSRYEVPTRALTTVACIDFGGASTSRCIAPFTAAASSTCICNCTKFEALGCNLGRDGKELVGLEEKNLANLPFSQGNSNCFLSVIWIALSTTCDGTCMLFELRSLTAPWFALAPLLLISVTEISARFLWVCWGGSSTEASAFLSFAPNQSSPFAVSCSSSKPSRSCEAETMSLAWTVFGKENSPDFASSLHSPLLLSSTFTGAAEGSSKLSFASVGPHTSEGVWIPAPLEELLHLARKPNVSCACMSNKNETCDLPFWCNGWCNANNDNCTGKVPTMVDQALGFAQLFQ